MEDSKAIGNNKISTKCLWDINVNHKHRQHGKALGRVWKGNNDIRLLLSDIAFWPGCCIASISTFGSSHKLATSHHQSLLIALINNCSNCLDRVSKKFPLSLTAVMPIALKGPRHDIERPSGGSLCPQQHPPPSSTTSTPTANKTRLTALPCHH